MKTTRKFCPADRYKYDFGECSYANGFAQVDTGQDASYYGTWANPTSMRIVSYCEGDVTIQDAETKEEFVSEIRGIKEWNEERGHGFLGIDALASPDIKVKFEELGLGDLLH